MTQNDSEGYIMSSNPWEGLESPATFALLVLVIPARLTRIRVVVLGLRPSYQTRDCRATITAHRYPENVKENIWWAPTMCQTMREGPWSQGDKVWCSAPTLTSWVIQASYLTLCTSLRSIVKSNGLYLLKIVVRIALHNTCQVSDP